MNKKILRLSLLIALLSLVFVGVVSAKQGATTGTPFNVFVGTPTTFSAGEPFHFGHGWGFDPPFDVPLGTYGWVLEVDGVVVEEDFILRTADEIGPVWRWIYNFPDGLSGDHTFDGYWTVQCRLVHGPLVCEKPGEQVVVIHRTVTTSFE